MGKQEEEVKNPYSALVYNQILQGFIYLFVTLNTFFYILKYPFNEKYLTGNFVIALIIVTFETICETLFYLHVTCLKNNDERYIIARSILVITMMSINICINNFLYSKHKLRCNSKNLILTISSINILSIALIVLNVLLLVNIKEYSSVKNASKGIKLAFFNKTEIAQIESGVYVKDEFYEHRVIATLEQVLESNYTQLAYSVHVEKGSRNYYYYIAFILDLFCNSEITKFYKDCENNNTQLKMIVRYINNVGSIPRYNCAYNESNKIVLDCPKLTNSYSLVLIQEAQDTVSLAWKSIANRNQVPTFYVDRNPILDPWQPFSKSNQLCTSKRFYFNFVICFILFLNIYSAFFD